MEPILSELFVAARGELTTRAVDPLKANFANLGAIAGDRKTAEAFTDEIELAAAQGRWLIYCFHGVGAGNHKHLVETEEHRRLCEFLVAAEERIWVAPVVDVALHLKQVLS